LPHGAREIPEIGHKEIYVANSFVRTLEAIGWQHAEPVLRSLAYDIMDRRARRRTRQSRLPADRSVRRNSKEQTNSRRLLDGKPNGDPPPKMLQGHPERVRRGTPTTR